MGLILLGPEQRGEAVEEAIQLGLEGQQLLLVHERPPGGADGGRSGLLLYQSRLSRRRSSRPAL
jgi:hypothetical protein